jgi:hypothetical protein
MATRLSGRVGCGRADRAGPACDQPQPDCGCTVNASGNWRIIFGWTEGDVTDVDLED